MLKQIFESSLLAQQPQHPQQHQLARRQQVQLRQAQGEHHVPLLNEI